MQNKEIFEGFSEAVEEVTKMKNSDEGDSGKQGQERVKKPKNALEL